MLFLAIRKRLDQDEKGFTLIELLVVVIIIGILAAIAIPAFLNQRERAWESAVESDLRNAAIIMETAATENGGQYPTTAPTFETSPNVTVTLGSSSTVNAFCLVGDHTSLAGNPDAWYDSDGGGLTDTAC